LTIDPVSAQFDVIHAAPSTPKGTSLAYLLELSQQLGLNLRPAYRSDPVELIVPSVVHFKLGHYAAITGQNEDRYLLQDPTFGGEGWATRDALETESSGYFLIPADQLGDGWRQVPESEGRTVWGKGYTCCSDPGPTGPCDPNTDQTCDGDGGPPPPGDPPPPPDGDGGGGPPPSGGGPPPSGGGPPPGPGGPPRPPLPPPGGGMCGLARVHLMTVSLNIVDSPVGYRPPVGPAVRFTVRYGQRDDFQPANHAYSNLGSKWTFDWLAYIQDDPTNPNASVQYYMMGGGFRTFTGFDPTTQRFAPEQYDQTLLARTANGYQLTARDGSSLTFADSDGATGTTRRVFLTELTDPAGNSVTLTYDANLRITTITDPFGEATTLAYDNPADSFKITKVTDPFGRFATFGYDSSLRLQTITDAADNISSWVVSGSR
jgi:YD repeat-containing protein